MKQNYKPGQVIPCDNPTELVLPDRNIYEIVPNQLALKVKDDMVLVLEDKFKTGYECKRCEGSGYIEDVCRVCEGTGKNRFGGACPECAEARSSAVAVASGDRPQAGKSRCPDCKGNGALLIAPQESERRPSSGTVVSCGDKVKQIKLQDRVFYSNYTGTAVNFRQKGILRIMREDEIIGWLYGPGAFADSVR